MGIKNLPGRVYHYGCAQRVCALDRPWSPCRGSAAKTVRYAPFRGSRESGQQICLVFGKAIWGRTFPGALARHTKQFADARSRASGRGRLGRY